MVGARIVRDAVKLSGIVSCETAEPHMEPSCQYAFEFVSWATVQVARQKVFENRSRFFENALCGVWSSHPVASACILLGGASETVVDFPGAHRYTPSFVLQKALVLAGV